MELKRDREVVIEAVTQHGRALRFASEELKSRQGCVDRGRQAEWCVHFGVLDSGDMKSRQGHGGCMCSTWQTCVDVCLRRQAECRALQCTTGMS